jgi:cysteine desulfurase
MTEPRPIYLDHHATTPCDPRVVEAMEPFWSEEFGNATSRTHAYGWRAAEAVERARRQVAALLGADAREIVFTSGATEANNLAILGAARGLRDRGDHVVTTRVEHKSVLDPCRALRREGFRVTELGVDREGLVDPAALRAAIEPRTVLVSILHANNEIGVVQPLAELAAIVVDRDVAFHADAAQSAGRIDVNAKRIPIDLLSMSAHKLYGPKGIGALYVRRRAKRIRIEPIVHGGGQEQGLRSGTLPVPLCVGFGRACEIASVEREAQAARMRALRDRLLERIVAGVVEVEVNGHLEQRLPGNLHLTFPGVEGEALLAALPDVALSAGSACTAASHEPSHVLLALGLDARRALSSVRFGIGRTNTEDEIDRAAARVIEEVQRLRAMSGVASTRAARGSVSFRSPNRRR